MRVAENIVNFSCFYVAAKPWVHISKLPHPATGRNLDNRLLIQIWEVFTPACSTCMCPCSVGYTSASVLLLSLCCRGKVKRREDADNLQSTDGCGEQLETDRITDWHLGLILACCSHFLCGGKVKEKNKHHSKQHMYICRPSLGSCTKENVIWICRFCHVCT